MTAEPLPTLRDVAAAHHGVLPRKAVLALGMRPAAIVTLLRRGTWVSVGYGCYALGDHPNLHAARCTARLLGLSGDVVVSHESAGFLLQLPYVAAPPSPTVTLVRRGAPDHRHHVHTALVPTEHRVPLFGFESTGGPRTLVDLLRNAENAFDAQALADGALRTGVRLDALDPVLELCRRWPGVELARAAIMFAEPRCESPLESWVRLLLRNGGLPAPTPQFTVRAGTRFVGRVDLCFEAERVVVECDGQVKYRTESSWATVPSETLWQEKVREDQLRAAGFRVIRAYARDREDNGADLCRRVREALALAGSRPNDFP